MYFLARAGSHHRLASTASVVEKFAHAFLSLEMVMQVANIRSEHLSLVRNVLCEVTTNRNHSHETLETAITHNCTMQQCTRCGFCRPARLHRSTSLARSRTLRPVVFHNRFHTGASIGILCFCF